MTWVVFKKERDPHTYAEVEFYILNAGWVELEVSGDVGLDLIRDPPDYLWASEIVLEGNDLRAALRWVHFKLKEKKEDENV